MTIGLFIVRVAVGVALVLQGSAKLTKTGRRSTGGYFESVGFRPGLAMAVVAGLTEFGAGVMLAAGLATPLAVAGAVGILLSVVVVSRPQGYWNSNGGVEYPLVMGVTAAALAFTGPGSFSLDEVIGWAEPTTGIAAVAVAFGLVAALPVLVRRVVVLRHQSDGATTLVAAEAA